MIVSVNKEYRKSITEIGKRLKNQSFMFDADKISCFEFSLETDRICITGVSGNERFSITYQYSELKKCDVRSFGYIITFKDRRWIHLPVTSDEKSNEELIAIGFDFEKRYSKFRFTVSERPVLNYESDKDKKKKSIFVSFSVTDSPLCISLAVVVSLFLGTVFVSMKSDYVPIDISEAVSYSGAFSSYHTDSNDYLRIEFCDGSCHTVHYRCASSALRERLAAIARGDELNIAVNKNNGYIIEISHNGEIILDSTESQERMLSEATAFRWLGIAEYCLAGYLTVYLIRTVIRERRHKKQH